MPPQDANDDRRIKTIPQNELTLAVLRDNALDLLLNKGVESSFVSKAHMTNNGLEVDTQNTKDKTHSKLLVEGGATYSPPLHGFHLDTQWRGDFTVTHINGNQRRTERDVFAYSGSMSDDWMKREDRSNITMTRMNAEGKPFQTYLPALSETTMRDGRLALDPNGQPLRLAREAGSSANCGLDYANRGGGNFDCNYLIRDSKFGKDISFNETHKNEPAGTYYRSVLRDRQGTVLGIMEQSFNVDQNGNLTDVRTSARRPDDTSKKR